MKKVLLFWMAAIILLVFTGRLYFSKHPVKMEEPPHASVSMTDMKIKEPQLQNEPEVTETEVMERDMESNVRKKRQFYKQQLSGLDKKYKEKKIDRMQLISERSNIILNYKEQCPQMSQERKWAFAQALKDFNQCNTAWDELALNNIDFHKTFIENNKYIKKGTVVADIGCGAGDYLFFFADRVGDEGKVYGVDIDPFCLDFLKKVRKSKEYKNITLIRNKPDDAMLPPDSIDFAYLKGVAPFCLGSVSEHPQETRRFTRSIYKGLRKNGMLYITNNAATEEDAEKRLSALISFIEKSGPFKLKYQFTKLDEYVLIFEKQ